MRYRVPVEFEAEDDDEARRKVGALNAYFSDMPASAGVVAVVDEITAGRTYWEKLPRENS
jgi:hypothetical protein